MIDQKRENLLNLALAATEVERRRVPELSAGGGRGRERGAAAGGEEDQVSACSGHGRCGHQIVAGAVEHVQALGHHGVTVADDR